MDPLESISPIDGRYRKYTEPLAKIFSEAGLMRYRVMVEVEYFISLLEHPAISTGVMTKHNTPEEKSLIRNIITEFSLDDAKLIQDIEWKGYKDIPATNHDVKAIEYFLKEKLREISELQKEHSHILENVRMSSLEDCFEYLHFALTSEDTNNIAYALMLSDGISNVLLPLLGNVAAALKRLAMEHKDLPMLARTHGQPASPTTFGKEFKVFETRLERQIEQLRNFKILAKLNGATGNYNAHTAAYPNVDWIQFTKDFIEKLNKGRAISLEPNLITTQIEPHDSYAELFDLLRRVNVILIGFDQDIWRYISDGWIAQKTVAGEVGSSTMPHKVNPIKFENSEGNLGIANALFGYFSSKLPISRLQRDLSDSTVERNFGVAFAHSVVGYSSLLGGLEKIKIDEERVKRELNRHPEVIAEAIQTILRREGVAMPYERLKELTRGAEMTLESMRAFIETLDLKSEVKQELLRLTPENYFGLASKLAHGEF